MSQVTVIEEDQTVIAFGVKYSFSFFERLSKAGKDDQLLFKIMRDEDVLRIYDSTNEFREMRAKIKELQGKVEDLDNQLKQGFRKLSPEDGGA